MLLWDILYAVVIGPIELVFETFFYIVNNNIAHNPVNPFTGKILSDDIKYEPEQYVFSTSDPNPKQQLKYTFIPGIWYSVHTDVRNPENWKQTSTDSTNPYGIK